MKKEIEEPDVGHDRPRWEKITVETSSNNKFLVFDAKFIDPDDGDEHCRLQVNISFLKEALSSTKILDETKVDVLCGTGVNVWSYNTDNYRGICIGAGVGTSDDWDYMSFTRPQLLELIDWASGAKPTKPLEKKLSKKQLAEQEKTQRVQQLLERYGDLVE